MILCCGEALIDMLPRETREGGHAFAPHIGGSVFNSAIALGRLGVPVGFYSGLSTDLFGTMLREALEESRVDLSRVRFSDLPTTLAFVHLDDGHASYRFYDENSAGRMLDAASLPALEGISGLLFGGISLVNEPAASAYEALMARAAKDRVVMLDPNIRPAFITDADEHRRRLARLVKQADIVKISVEDLEWLKPNTGTAEAASQLLEAGCHIVVVTSGGDGARVFLRDEELHVPAHKVEVVDTVGAGDTFNAGLLAALHEGGKLGKAEIASLKGADLSEALSFAARVAAITVSRAGANPPWANELEAA
ncbi:carbohydrate kinase family protein [Nitratireductor basaltis]|uniref:Fructokinase n=1 Tax=Nitratireductor basaltis TaxID=472175 RepID=A0A084UCM7_9HYPH|nr:carbohydrate kinase [Nitratireductor basaltis]KFB10713.1 Fructokinase [Nitratireductor basaltis]